MIIDFHTHCYPDKIAKKVINNFKLNFGLLSNTNGTLEDLRLSMLAAGIDFSVLLPIATKPGQNPKLNLIAKANSQNGIISFGSVYPFDPNWKKQIDEVVELGLPGIKLHPDFQEFYFAEKHIIEMISYALDKKLLVTVHVGVDPACLDLVHSTPEMARHLLDSVDSEHLILAHLGGHLSWDEVLESVAGCNCYLDTALCVGAINSRKLIEIFEKHGYDRILFGSDSPWGNQRISVQMMSGLHISQENMDKIMYKNALKLLGI